MPDAAVGQGRQLFVHAEVGTSLPALGHGGDARAADADGGNSSQAGIAPACVRLAEVVLACGFRHFARFAQDDQLRCGQAPSATLLRRRGA
ncbi:MAG: hypothetical protein WAQ05_02165 [Rubrivivax sp.]